MEVINLDEVNPSSSLPGIELLMNDKKKEKDTITLSDIDKLESELNSLSAPLDVPLKIDPIEFKSDFPRSEPKTDFPRSETIKINMDPPSVKFDIPDIPKKDPS